MISVNLYIFFSDNNTIMTLTTLSGSVLYWCTSGKVRFKGTKKGTLHASKIVASDVKEYIISNLIKNVFIIVKGLSSGKDAILKVFSSSMFVVSSIVDKTPIAFNGCRPRKARRT